MEINLNRIIHICPNYHIFSDSNTAITEENISLQPDAKQWDSKTNQL